MNGTPRNPDGQVGKEKSREVGLCLKKANPKL